MGREQRIHVVVDGAEKQSIVAAARRDGRTESNWLRTLANAVVDSGKDLGEVLAMLRVQERDE